ncbi:WD40 repeat domain-containing protein [Planktothrix sp. FACHB-1365]|uniref:WD40 repeat domain-containing protein n=1 Tax=Planktothrix sp. FACHB-1365 TaxID=2692855 RepID=UPI0016865DCE|nr:WD40 repeat domain-containing protein [Planktothrix sp. FACHB-1365]MBD2484644.1 WD40 repeat domain-containing protein [Planktothrix sp. FACHB-1365]
MGRVTLKASPCGLQKANAALNRFSSKIALADRAQLSRTTVQAFFAGKRISADSFRLICKELNLPWEDIAGIETDVPSVTPTESAKTQGSESDPAITTKKASEICPYKGLLAFTTEDAALFFGREEFTQTLVDSVQKRPFVAVIGNSGSGKSSVVYAGLIHQLKEQGGWKFITFRPTSNPFSQLAYPLLSLLEPEMDKMERLTKAKKYANNFKAGELTLKDVLDANLQENSSKQRFLIFVDQFEEVYTLCTEENERKIFIDQLLEVINAESETKSPNIVLVITLRADFYGHAIDYQPLLEIFQKCKPENIGPMKPDELQAAIEKPAKEVNLTIQDGLTKIILDAVKSNPGELPLLEFCLEQLWEKQSNGQLTIAAYNEIGGVEKALANHAEENYHKLHEDKQNRVKHIFTQLVRFGENTEATRRIATREQIGAENWLLVTELANARLVVTGRDEDKKQLTVEVVHEALIRGWDRLREWMEEDQEFRKWQDRLRAEKDIWKNSSKDNGALLRGALLVEAEEWLKQRSECIIDQEEREFILASRQYQEQEDIERIKDLLTLSQKELQLKQQLSSLVIAVKAGVKLHNIQEPSEELKRNVIERLQQGSYEISERNQLIGHQGEVDGVSFSPDGQIIASVSDDHTVKTWRLEGQILNTLKGHTNDVLEVSFSPDGQTVASASADKTVRLWSLDGTLLRTLEGHTDLVYGVSFSPDGQTIASASADKTVRLWSLDGTLLRILEGHTDRIWGVSFSPNSQIIASASVDKTVKLWSLDGTLLRILEGHSDPVYRVSFSPDGQTIASASGDKTIKLWSLDGKLLRTLEGHSDRIYGVSFSPDGQTIASASFDRTVRLWNLDGILLRTLEGHTDRVYGVSFSCDSQIIASASVDRTVRLWNLDGILLRTLEGHSAPVWGVSFSRDGQMIASVSEDRTVRLWNPYGKLLRTLQGHSDRIWGVSFSRDGQTIASASVDKTVRLWSLDGTLLRTLEGHSDRIWGVSFSPDGQTIASASADKTVRLWSLDGTLLRILEGHSDPVWGVSFSPDGQTIASASADKTVRLWSLDGTLLRILEGHSDSVYGVSFSPNGQTIASASGDRTVKLWSLDGTLLRILEGHIDRVWRVKFNLDGQIIASASADRTVRLWSLDGTLFRTLEGHTDQVYGVSFSPDGKTIASASHDKTVRLWPIDPNDLILDLDVKLNKLLKKGCNWIRDYLKTNPNVSESDRHICDGICSEDDLKIES